MWGLILLLQVLAKGGWAGLDDITKLLPGPTFAEHKAQSVKGTVYFPALRIFVVIQAGVMITKESGLGALLWEYSA